jgi:HD-like signal output (HDOD) protein
VADRKRANDFERRLLASPSVPTAPSVAQRLLELLRADAELGEIADAIAVDAALASKLLRAVNSPLYGLAREVCSLREALVYLGVNTVRCIALSFSFAHALRGRSGAPELESAWRSSLVTALAARRFARQLRLWNPDEAFLAGLICDVGVLLLYDALPEYRALFERFGRGGGDLIELERAELPTDHARLGALLLRSWSFPEPLWQLVECHHRAGEHDDGDATDVRLKILNAAWISARAFVFEGFRAEVPELRRWLAEYLRLPDAAVESILDDLHEELRETAAEFEIPLGAQRSFQDLLVEANDALRELALRSEARFRVLSATSSRGRRRFADLRAALELRSADRAGLLSPPDLELLLEAFLPCAAECQVGLGMLVAEAALSASRPPDAKPDPEVLAVRLAERVRTLTRPDDEVARLGQGQVGVVLLEVDGGALLEVAARLQSVIEATGLELGGEWLDVELAVGGALALPRALPPGPAEVLGWAREALGRARRSAPRIALVG